MKPLDPSMKVQWSAKALEKIKSAPQEQEQKADLKEIKGSSSVSGDFKSLFDRNWKSQTQSHTEVGSTSPINAMDPKTTLGNAVDGKKEWVSVETHSKGLKINFSSQAQALNKEASSEVVRTQKMDHLENIEKQGSSRARKQYETMQNASDETIPTNKKFNIKIE